MLAGAGCRRRLLAGYVNLDATVEALASEAEVWLVCAGKLGRFALEDATCAGTLTARLAARGAMAADDGARSAVALACRDAADVLAVLEGCDHGRWLATLGAAYAGDVRLCAGLDTLDLAADW
jgi:2-phosphosulfolactate phosphatase